MIGAVAISLMLNIGCAGGDTTTDVNDTNVVDDGHVDVEQPEIIFTRPDTADRVLVAGTYKAKVKYSDPKSKSATLTVTILGQDGFVPYDIPVEGPGSYDISVDTKKLADGNKTIQVEVATVDGREARARAKILVDNNSPVIEVLEPTPLEGSNFMDDLALRFRITDPGNKVHSVVVTVGDYEWVWPQNAEQAPVAELDTRTSTGKDTYEDIVVPIAGWTGGDKVVTVSANDGIEGHNTLKTLNLKFVEVPGFVVGEKQTLPTGTVASVINGIRLGLQSDKIWAVAVNDAQGIFIYKRERAGVMKLAATAVAEPCLKFLVADMNGDLLDDIVVYRMTGTDRDIAIFTQSIGPEDAPVFEEFVSIPVLYDVTDMAVGFLNSDKFPDIALTTTASIYSTSIILSQIDEFDEIDTWGEEKGYSGAVNPERVAIGKFGAEGKNAVVVGKRTSGSVTVFPVDEDGVPTSGENSNLDPQNDSIKGISGLAAVNFEALKETPNSLFFLDSEGDDVVGVAVAEPLAYFRVIKAAAFSSGIDPVDLAVGDINADGTVDVVVLCTGANMIQVYNGVSPGLRPYVTEGASLLSGAAKDVTLGDMDNDGFLDIVLLNREGNGLMTVFYRHETGRSRFEGSYQTKVGFSPLSVATGHFLTPLEGAGQSYLDAAALVMGDASRYYVKVFASDPVVAMPVTPTSSVNVDILMPKKIVAGNYDSHLGAGGTIPYSALDDLIVTSGETAVDEDSLTAQSILFHPNSHSTASSTVQKFWAGNEPAAVAVADFDRNNGTGGGQYDVLDAAFLTHARQTDTSAAEWIIRPMMGFADGLFNQKTAGGVTVEPLRLPEASQPRALFSFPLQRTLGAYVNRTAADNELLSANSGTGDFIVFLNKGIGGFESIDADVKAFAVGGAPVDIEAGYLRSPIDGTAAVDAANNELPDVVTLLSNDVVVSYSLDKAALAVLGDKVGFESVVALGYPGNNATAVDLRDMNGDSFVDIVVLDKDMSMVWIYVNLARRKFSAPYSFSTGTTPVEMSIADMDGDGCLDIVTADLSGKTLTTLRNTSTACRK